MNMVWLEYGVGMLHAAGSILSMLVFCLFTGNDCVNPCVVALHALH